MTLAPLMWLHPILQILCFFLAAYVLYLGYSRFLVLHRGVKTLFAWKRHVSLGYLAMLVWIFGPLLGILMAYLSWNMVLVTGLHYVGAAIMAPLILFGLGSGIYMDKRKKKRALLPLAHAVNNALLVLLALSQLVTGIGVIRNFLLP